jgi:lipoate-protein ligase A
MKWRLLPFETRSAALNMAIDEAIMESVAMRTSPPTVRFYGWSPSAVSIGCFQNIGDEVDLKRCRELGIDVVRRRTGGGAVFHAEGGEITYSLIAPEPIMPQDIDLSYSDICGRVVQALRSLGLASEFKPINDILVEGKKISGSAQTRRGGILLQHGTLLLHLDEDLMFQALRVGKKKIEDKGLSDARERVTSLDRHAQASEERVLAALAASFSAGIDSSVGYISKAEMTRAQEIAEQRYLSQEWTFSR